MPRHPTDAASLRFLTGQVYALKVFCQALARTSPLPNVVLNHYSAAEQIGLKAVGTLPRSDDLIVGYQETVSAIKTILADAMKH